MRGAYKSRPWEGSTKVPPLADLPRGAIVARARLVDVVFTLNSGHRSADARLRNGQACMLCGRDYSVGSCPKPDPWAVPGALGLILADVVPLAMPVPFRGALGFFEVPDGILHAEVRP